MKYIKKFNKENNKIIENNITPEEPVELRPANRKKIIILGATILLFVVIAIIFSVIANFSKKTDNPTSTVAPTKAVEQKKGTISIEPSTLSLGDNSALNTAYVLFDGEDISTTEVEFDIEYETGAITNFNVKAYSDPNSALGQSLRIIENSINTNTGTTHSKFSLKNGYFEQKGSAKLAVITFNTKVVSEYSLIKFAKAKFSYKPAGATYTPNTIPLRINSTIR